ncbi:hypothetical protein [Oceanibaculum indicum]|uniref:hypothetical protein n=1 Tax=Oceanibaculum indicum TaxID=526216 RepID=UPI0012EAECD0|nr:hypothetical protein [Oceanibaculum indicum]
MWESFGFSRNLYDTHPVEGNDQGERLLVGRSNEVTRIKSRISGFRTVLTLEGPNGVGKTSLVLVSGHQLQKESEGRGKSSYLLLPEPVQFTQEDTAVDFKRKVYSKIASHFIANERDLRSRLDLQFSLGPLRAWLENPLNFEGSISIAGFGGGGGRTPNESTGFDVHGFFTLVDRLLQASFTNDGGIICVLDNLEILNTSQLARQRLETLRDDLFAKHGLKWVVCGARGIVRSVASSPRLQGRLLEPIEVNPLDGHSIDQLIASRVAEFRTRPDSIPPVGADSFKYVFKILNNNLRDSLKYSGDFAAWLDENQRYNETASSLDDLFQVWLADQSERYFTTINVPPRAWQLFDDICEKGGSISPSDYEDFGFNSPQHMRGQVAKLEQADLVVSELDDTDHRRKTISVQAKGWLLRHHRTGYRPPD